MFEYKVEVLEATITESDLKKGLGGAKVIAQVEIKLRELSEKGFELHSQNFISVEVQPGCFSKLQGIKEIKHQMMVLIFKRAIK